MAVWIVRAAGDAAKEREALAGGCCIAGWDELVDFRSLDERTLKDAIGKAHPAKSNAGIAGWASQIIRFRDVMAPGDTVVMPTGGGTGVLHVGVLEGEYVHAPAIPGGRPRHKRAVRWIGSMPKLRVAAEAKGTIGAFLTVYRVEKPAFERQLRGIIDSTGS